MVYPEYVNIMRVSKKIARRSCSDTDTNESRRYRGGGGALTVDVAVNVEDASVDEDVEGVAESGHENVLHPRCVHRSRRGLLRVLELPTSMRTCSISFERRGWVHGGGGPRNA
jgi:hypothetical protein